MKVPYRILVLLFLFAPVAVSIWMMLDRELPPKRSGAMQSLDYWAAVRAYPAETIPPDGYFRGFLQDQAMSRSMEPLSEQWDEIGPHNLAGRTLALAFNPQNPNTIYAGSASGGLWVSRTAGIGADAWDYVPTGFPVLGVSSIAISPTDSNVMYIGTGEVYGYQDARVGLSIRTTRGSYGIGILKTTDGGSTWFKCLDWSYNQERGVQAVRINPLNTSTVWAATTEGVYKSTDAGATWVQSHNVIMAMDLAINPIDTNIVFAGCGNLASAGHGMYRSTNGGASWSKLTHPSLPSYFEGKIQFSIYAAAPNVVFASIGMGYVSGSGTRLCKSVDHGTTWTVFSATDYATYQGWYSHGVAVHPTDSSKVICAGIDIWKSTNGGQSLTKKSFWYNYYGGRPEPGEPEGPPDYSHADHHTLLYHPTNHNIIYFGNDGGVFRSTDGGETFESRNGGYQSAQFYNGFANSQQDSTKAIGGLQDNATAMYRGDGAWERDLIGGDGAWCAVDPLNDNIVYGSVYYLSMYKSTDDGVNWSYISPSIGGDANFVSPFSLAPSSPNILYAATSYIARSTTGGASWSTLNGGSELNGDPVLSMAVAPANPNVCYVGTTPWDSPAEIFVTTNGGSSFSNITGSLPDRYPVDLGVRPDDPATGYVVFGGFGTSHVFKTTNYGSSWMDIGSGLPDVPTSAVAVDPMNSQHVYVGNDIGVYVSTDGGAAWSVFQNGLPDAVMVMDLSISPANGKIRAATHGNGVYERRLISTLVAVGDDGEVPGRFALEQNYPNPFNPTTTIRFSVPGPTRVSLVVYNALGETVKRLVHNQFMPAGSHQAVWDGTDDRGRRVAGGLYLVRLAAGSRSDVRKMLMVK